METEGRTGQRERVDPQRSTVQRLDLSQGEVRNVLPDVGVQVVPVPCRGRIETFSSVDHFVVPDNDMAVFG